MSKKNRERRGGEPGAGPAEGGNGAGGVAWLPIVMAVAALGFGFMAWTDTKKIKTDLTKRIVDLDTKLTQVQKAANAKPAAPQQVPDPNKVYTVRTEGSPYKGNPSAPIVIAEFSEYQ